MELKSRKPLNDWFGLIAFIVVCLGCGGLGAIVTTPEIDGWYQSLAKPMWNPPNWLFGPVWTTLFILMAISGWLVWRQCGSKANRLPLSLFGLQLLLNVGWSWIFFGLHRPGWAALEITALWLVIASVIVVFFRYSKTAGWLMSPYLAWVTFAAILNFAIWQLNATDTV